MPDVRHVTLAELEAGLDTIRQSPRQEGVLAMIVRRTAIDEREVMAGATLDVFDGLVGDGWRSRGGSGTANPDTQLALMNARTIALLAQSEERWLLAGDQLLVDLDLSLENLPARTRLALGTAVIEVTPQAHSGCRKFLDRFGAEALKFVNSPVGKELRLRGVYAKVVQAGVIRVGDVVKKL